MQIKMLQTSDAQQTIAYSGARNLSGCKFNL